MRTDKFSNPIFNETDIYNALYLGKHIDFNILVVDKTNDIKHLEEVAGQTFQPETNELNQYTVEEFDAIMQTQWFMPDEYFSFDIEQYCISKCNTDIEKQRVYLELKAYKDKNLIRLLQWLKYFVDTCIKNNIVWGVGRGSSVASYVLYLLNVHQINPMKFDILFEDFIK